METTITNRKTVHRTVKVGDIPKSWQVDLPDDPDVSVTVPIALARKPGGRRLVDFIGSGKGVYGTLEEADAYLCNLREERKPATARAS
jgi:hypothetical protein